MLALIYTFAALGQFALFFAVHLLIWRYIQTSHPKLKLMLMLAVLVFAVSVTITALFWIDLTLNLVFLISLPVFSCLMLLYIHLYVGMLKSVSLRIVGDLTAKPEHADDIPNILRDFSLYYMVQTRLDLLETNGWLQKSGAQYICLPKATRVAIINNLLKRIYGLRVTG